jgi:hypothetical protein
VPLNNFSKLELHGDHIDVYGWTRELPPKGQVLKLANHFMVVQGDALAIGDVTVDSPDSDCDWHGKAFPIRGQFTPGEDAKVQGIAVVVTGDPANPFQALATPPPDPPPPWENTLTLTKS